MTKNQLTPHQHLILCLICRLLRLQSVNEQNNPNHCDAVMIWWNDEEKEIVFRFPYSRNRARHTKRIIKDPPVAHRHAPGALLGRRPPAGGATVFLADTHRPPRPFEPRPGLEAGVDDEVPGGGPLHQEERSWEDQDRGEHEPQQGRGIHRGEHLRVESRCLTMRSEP